MSISQLVSVLRIAFKIEDFDKIEQELVKREAKLRAEIGRLQEKIELERLQGIEFEERLKIREEQCERGKRAQEDYEQLLKEVKTNGWIEKHAIEELRRKNVALEREVCELKEFKKIMLDDVNSVDQLRDKIRVLKESTHCSVDTGNARSPKKGNKEDAVGALEQKKDQTEACKEGVKFKLEKEIVDLGDDDNDARYTSQGLRGEQTISQKIAENEHLQRVEMIKRQRASDIQASTSTFTSSADLFEKENLPVKRSVMGKDIQSPAKKIKKGYPVYRAQRVSGPIEPLAHEVKHGSKQVRVYVRKKQSFLS
ncbi:uncharacterized protein LOC124837899 [Vigna umbellata]|uniref:uncharacterized protein LOC124837899 n=1 Tax=Vigna umbellata TaxID=87088 RepID=UPI001F5E6F00|nr:uncharacterized protein LOC124837899 [Vigna umbellata]